MVVGSLAGATDVGDDPTMTIVVGEFVDGTVGSVAKVVPANVVLTKVLTAVVDGADSLVTKAAAMG